MIKPTAKTPGVFDMVNVSSVCARADLSGEQLRRAYDWTVELWERLGVPPESLAVKGADFPPSRKLRDFRRMRSKLEQVNFSELQYVGLQRMLPESSSPGQQMTEFSLARKAPKYDLWHSFICLFPPAIDISEAETERYLLEFAALTAGRYGYIMYKKWNSAFWYTGGILGQAFDDPSTEHEEAYNINRWPIEPAESELVLRDLYPVNLLTRPFLDLPFGDTGTTLQEWIEKNADDRGTLEPLAGAEHVTIWRPVIANMPQLRTELFRAGLLFYWRHFDSSQPEYRDFSKPFAPPDQIPAIFRPEFYAGRDPKVTR